MTELHGKNLIAGEPSALGAATFRAMAPKTGAPRGPAYHEATRGEIESAAERAEEAFASYGALPGPAIAALLERIAEEIAALGEALIECAHEETALPPERLVSERARTMNQFRMFAEVARDGAWRDIRIDRALEDRKPLRRPDLRRILVPIGPVAVWAASNFPLAFSVGGGDTASALAAGCPVVAKAHPGHPGTSELVADAIYQAIRACGIPPGIFSLLHGTSPEVSLALVRQPQIAAGAFTGSLRAGRALFDAATQRPAPIPFFAEMGSVNPVFLLPRALAERGETIADGLFQSVNLGVGQFCTCPGIVAALPGAEPFLARLRDRFRQAPSGTMLTAAIAHSYRLAVAHLESLPGVSATKAAAAGPVVFETDARAFFEHDELGHEVFGPATIVVRCGTAAEMEQLARGLEGSLTATVHGTAEDLREYRSLLAILARKAGRLVCNGFPTGVEVCAAMQHGGPYPATTDPRFTSVGTAAIQRFARPVCFQDFPPEFLPAELQDK
jgi:NADP-dependent aldehyde dehydrogenase